MGGFKNLMIDMAVDAAFVFVRRERCPTVVHVAPWDGKTAHGMSLCGTKERGGWRCVSAEYTELPRCQRCERHRARLTHQATEQERRDAKSL